MDKKEKKNQKIIKKINNEKQKNIKKEEKEKNKKSPKERITNFIIGVKEVCVKDTSRMILFIAILFALYIVINLWVRSLNLAQIDLTASKRFTLTEQSKSIARQIDNDMTFYIWGFSENSSPVTLSNITDLLNLGTNSVIIRVANSEGLSKSIKSIYYR